MPKRLEDLIDVEELFKRGDSFLMSVRIIHMQGMDIMVACAHGKITCDAFCCEIYMKILAQLESGKPPLEGHNIKYLANDLTAKSYRRMERNWKREHKKNIQQSKNPPPGVPVWARMPPKFETALEKSARAFVDWRYGEKGELRAWFAEGLSDELREMILELRPEWRPLKGPRTMLNPKPDLAETKDNQGPLTDGGIILNRQPTSINIQTGKRSYPNDRGTR